MIRTILSSVMSLSVFCAVSAAQANVDVYFSEGAPKDRFIITNQGECDLNALTVTFDLSTSQGKLIFDITGSGAGVEVFQPFEVTEGSLRLAPGTSVKDGDSSLSVAIKSLKTNEQASFTIDVDDTLTVSDRGMIIVSGSEVSGGEVELAIDGTAPVTTTFADNSRATFRTSCGT
ncbi:aggregation factor core [Leucothrix pacifica]|uniref:Aggregation factor core n=1 Tax=Leucothrix pacifica TaxID=1247513 RepID=A0A317CPD4_9GAMM|nr:aggregation factor core [Leucothrix pacifica]PWQ98162.1 aggregation factor core [Leucothrix pacifica]